MEPFSPTICETVPLYPQWNGLIAGHLETSDISETFMSFVFYATTINVIIEFKKLLILIINGGNTRGAITSRDIRYLTPFKISTCARFKKKKDLGTGTRLLIFRSVSAGFANH